MKGYGGGIAVWGDLDPLDKAAAGEVMILAGGGPWLQSEFAMQSEPHEFEAATIRLAVSQDRIGPEAINPATFRAVGRCLANC